MLATNFRACALRGCFVRPRNFLVKRGFASVAESNLHDILIQAIKNTGPLSLANYMQQCLTNPIGGYYVNRDPIGRSGDFVTSPEISQMFGELIGVWVLAQWMVQGKPSKFRILELGPGRGTLMSDLLRATKKFKPFIAGLEQVALIESSPVLREIQHQKLAPESKLVQVSDCEYSSTTSTSSIRWYEDLKQISESAIPTFCIAHEFFDAMPIYQFERTSSGWREIMVDYGFPNETNKDSPEFFMKVNKNANYASNVIPKSHVRYDKLPVDSRIEVSPVSWDIAANVATIISKNGGAALFIDYGPAHTIPINTLRGIKDHKLVSPMVSPGEVDLSADVDFQGLKIAAMRAGGIRVDGPAEQGDWLHEMGIGARATQLANIQTSEEGKRRIESAYDRLTGKGPNSMGKIYKFMSVSPSKYPEPVGFGGHLG